MPFLHDGADRCALQIGTYTVGGLGADALPITSLECSPAVATLVVSPSEPATLQRIKASVIVRVDRVPLGIAPKPLHHGAEIEFGDTRLTFIADDHDALDAPFASSSSADTNDWPLPEGAVVPNRVPSDQPGTARIVRVSTGDAIELGSSRVVVGRDESCDFVVPGMRVSRRHFSVAPVQGGYLLRDESANGTLVNGSRISGTLLLAHGDVLRLHDEELRFEMDNAALPVPTPDAPATEVLDLSAIRQEYTSASLDEPKRGPQTATLEIVRGRYSGASFSIDRAVCAIGRGPQSDIRIRDDSVSTNHATLLRKGTSWFVVDLRSANGTLVDGSRVAGERELPSGSRLKLGSVELIFRALDGNGEVPRPDKRKRSWLSELLRPFRRQPATAESE